MAEFVYTLCAITSIVCAILLLRAYRRARSALLFWSGTCFIGLAANNMLLLVDRYVVPDLDLFVPRTLIALAAMSVLLYGLIIQSR